MKFFKTYRYKSFLKTKIFLFWAILLLPYLALAQTDKEFWFVAPYVYDAGRNFDKPINLRITTSSSPATITISMPANSSFIPITQNIAANTNISVDLTPWITQLENSPANTILNKGLHITSTADITAYYEVVSSYCNCNPEIFSLKGKNALGTEFFISSQYSYNESTAYSGATNSFDIVATKDNTHLTITPAQNIVGHNANIPFTVILNTGQTYSAVASSSAAAGHLQGSYVSSDNPVAVTLKDDLVQVSSCADLAGDQTVPTSVLGTEYIVTKGYLQPADNIYITATEDGTSVYIDGNTSPTTVLAKGASYTLNLYNPSTYIRSDKKIYVYHFTGNGCEVGSAIIPKLNCTGSTSVSVVRSSSDLFAATITTKNGNQGNFIVNGSNTLVKSSDFMAVPGTGGTYVTARVDLSTIPVGNPLSFANSTGSFSLGLINGGANDGVRYGFFSDFKSTNVQKSSVEVCASTSTQLNAYGGVAYKWSPATGLSDPNIANPIASPTTTTDYSVVITTADGCIDSAKVHVKVLSARTVDTTVTICQGQSYKLPSGKIVNTSGTYNDIASYKSSGCDSIVTTLHLITTGLTPSVTISASQNNICTGTPVMFTASAVNGGASPIYQWMINGINVGTNNPIFSSSTLSNGDKVSCTLTSSSSCIISSSVTSNIINITVNAIQSPAINITASQNNICAGGLVSFSATSVNGGAMAIYQWQINGVNAGSNSPNFSSSNLVNGDKITCILQTSAACTTPSSVTSNVINITVNPDLTPSVIINPSTNGICPGDIITFTATPVNGGSVPTYQWQLNGNNTGTNSPVFSSKNLLNGDVVNCILTSNNACLTTPTATSNSITINVNTPLVPSVIITASKNNVCSGTSIQFTATPFNEGSSPIYEWFINGKSAGTNNDTFISSNLADNDIVSCRLTSNAFCTTPSNVNSNNIVMVIYPSPFVNGGGNKIIESGTSIKLNAKYSGNIANIIWSPSTGLDDPTNPTPLASPEKTTTYTVTVQSVNGCTATDEVKVTVQETISIPNAFTPNGDGINDKWEIKHLVDYPDCLVQVFNRWGREIYRSRGYYNAWDGTINGKRVPFGTYYYVINLNNKTVPLSGFVAIIR